MYAISFDMTIESLKQFYGEPYNNAYYEISNILEQYDFYRIQGSVYLSPNGNMLNLTQAADTICPT